MRCEQDYDENLTAITHFPGKIVPYDLFTCVPFADGFASFSACRCNQQYSNPMVFAASA